MVRANAPTDQQLEEMAHERMGGSTWESIARTFHRAVQTVRRWPVRYEDRWREAMRRAERRVALDTEAEAILALRRLLRDDDSRIRWHAAKAILLLRIELGKLDLRSGARDGPPLDQETRENLAIVEYYKRMPPEQVANLERCQMEYFPGLLEKEKEEKENAATPVTFAPTQPESDPSLATAGA